MAHFVLTADDAEEIRAMLLNGAFAKNEITKMTRLLESAKTAVQVWFELERNSRSDLTTRHPQGVRNSADLPIGDRHARQHTRARTV